MRFIPATLLLASTGFAEPSLLGVHWYGNPADLPAMAQPNPLVEQMAAGRALWVLEIAHVDTNAAPPWDLPAWWQTNYNPLVLNGRQHAMIYRLQPYWSRNVPHSGDPFSVADFATAAAAAVETFGTQLRHYQIGNEVNLLEENLRWSGSAYDTPWAPTPEEYAATYRAVRTAMHATGGAPIALMQPVSPGEANAARFMDGNEYLWRQIAALPADEIDGFALHAYAEPGGENDGLDGFLDSLREQLMIIDELGHGDKVALITEFNKHMPNASEAAIGARFVQAAYQSLAEWNSGARSQTWPGRPAHRVSGACWFVNRSANTSSIDADVWNAYSLEYWRGAIAGTNPATNPWYGFQAAAATAPASGPTGGGVAPPRDLAWWSDDFATLDTAGPLPDWHVEPSNGAGTASASGGRLYLRGTGNYGGASVYTRGYTFGNFSAVAEFQIVDGAQLATAAGEANIELRIREGSQAYSLTFFTSASDAARRDRIILRRKGTWQQIGTNNVSVPGGIGNGSAFRVFVQTDGASLRFRVLKTAGTGASTTNTVADFIVQEDQLHTGWIRIGTYNMREAAVDRMAVGGADWLEAQGFQTY